MDGNFDDVAINTFKSSLPAEHGLRKSLTGKPTISVRQLMDRIDKYKQVEEDQMQGRGKEKVIPQKRRDFRSDRYTNSRPRRDFVGNQRRPAHGASGLYSESQCTRFWRRSRTNHTSDGRTKWRGSPQSETRTCTANTTRIMDTPWKIVGTYGIIWISWSEKES